MNELNLKISRIISDNLGVELSKIRPEAIITKDLGADSLDSVELILSMKHEFGIEIPDSDLDNIKSVNDIFIYINQRINHEK